MTCTHQFVQHDQQTDTSEIDGVSVSGDDKLTHSLRLETGPSSATRDAIGKSARRQRQRAVDDGDMGVRLGSNVVQPPPDLGLQGRLRGRRVEYLAGTNGCVAEIGFAYREPIHYPAKDPAGRSVHTSDRVDTAV